MDRIRRYGEAGWYRGENIYLGAEGSVVVDNMLTELTDKSKRDNIFHKHFKLTGIYSCSNADRKLTVIVYADSMKLND